MSISLKSAQSIFSNTLIADAVPAVTAAFDQLSVEDQLALLWYAYTEMGVTITPAATGSASMALAQPLLDQIKAMQPTDQTQVMTDFAMHTDTPICRSYTAFRMNTKLGFWYELGQMMKQGLVAPIPPAYVASPEATALLETIKQLDAGQQITVLRNTVVNMGFDPARGQDYDKREAPSVTPRAFADRSRAAIEGVDNYTVLSYIDNMNAFDFMAASGLFAPEGALQPPFQGPVVGPAAILTYMREECVGLKMLPERGVVESIDDGYTQVKVTGKVQSPWFGASVGMNIAWRFLLDPQGKIFFVAIVLLASPKELLNLRRV